MLWNSPLIIFHSTLEVLRWGVGAWEGTGVRLTCFWCEVFPKEGQSYRSCNSRIRRGCIFHMMALPGHILPVFVCTSNRTLNDPPTWQVLPRTLNRRDSLTHDDIQEPRSVMRIGKRTLHAGMREAGCENHLPFVSTSLRYELTWSYICSLPRFPTLKFCIWIANIAVIWFWWQC